MAYSKLFSSIVHSSLWTEEDHVRLLFVTLLAIADREGYVYGSRMGLERLANIICSDHERDPWDALMEPDKDSSDRMRNPENEGRRIEEVPGGFRILNYCYYRSLRNDEDRRDQNREAQRRHREKLSQKSAKSSQDKPVSAKVSHEKSYKPRSSHAEAEAKAESEQEIIDYCKTLSLPESDGKSLWLKWEENGWTNNGKPIKNWRMTIQRWKLDKILPSQKPQKFQGFSKPKEPAPGGEAYRIWDSSGKPL